MSEFELKTLKDFEIEPCGGYCHYHNAESLKLEAIKWVKEIRKDKKPENLDFREWRSSNYGAENWIKHFFNITEEELK